MRYDSFGERETLAQRRRALRSLCGCVGGALLFPAAGAQQLLKATAPENRSAGEAYSKSLSQSGEAASMAASIASSLNSLTAATDKALEQVDTLQKKAGELSTEIDKLTVRKEELLEEYRQGLFCSGCGKTKSQILARGETFPHSGQTIIRPTPAQIAAKEKELQAPIDSDRKRLDDTRKALDDNNSKAKVGLEQIYYGTRLWRTSSSYWEFAIGNAAYVRQKDYERKIDDLKKAMARAEQAQAGKPRRPEDEEEKQTLQRLVVRLTEEAQQASRETGKLMNEAQGRIADQRSAIATYVKRGKLFARAGDPPGVPIYPSATDMEMGSPYLMGRMPEKYTPALAEVMAFCADYRGFGAMRGVFIATSGGAPTAGGAAPTAAALPPPRPTVPAANTKLLNALP